MPSIYSYDTMHDLWQLRNAVHLSPLNCQSSPANKVSVSEYSIHQPSHLSLSARDHTCHSLFSLLLFYYYHSNLPAELIFLSSFSSRLHYFLVLYSDIWLQVLPCQASACTKAFSVSIFDCLFLSILASFLHK